MLDALRQPDVRLFDIDRSGGTGMWELALDPRSSTKLATVSRRGRFRLARVGLKSFDGDGAIARALDVRESSEQSVFEAIEQHTFTSGRCCSFSNFEHVVDAATVVSDLMIACPKIDILVTSRIALPRAWRRIPRHCRCPIPASTARSSRWSATAPCRSSSNALAS
ncbi:MAG: hypothetical protein R2849_16045 [Thermomicrobiales bacterium]